VVRRVRHLDDTVGALDLGDDAVEDAEQGVRHQLLAAIVIPGECGQHNRPRGVGVVLEGPVSVTLHELHSST